jgi:hypothetical protein
MIPTLRIMDIANFGPKYKPVDHVLNEKTAVTFVNSFLNGVLKVADLT